ncbi:DUF1810 domain-containing protein [Variovorax sp. Sphag1AA]|uniref:DUF1810 domain-containing protein n=1 Tax=Variovorax sp. Sphag1AA TaxID=2587027 RepID=UPI00161EF93D|nr:DUF1810 domain-containing protein [Variovorax sp. Sphag1AA]MBB3182222.1 uncharacterized protein (DUF1810 family) [Variovorax sp. Sphag1AA]
MNDPFALQRFVDAQADVIDTAMDELRAGRKRSHWMWFVFPQLAGLGRSTMAQHYAISSLEESRAYLAHPVLGPRLRQCSEIVLDVQDRSVGDIFGSPDDQKFWSSMTLFSITADSTTTVFRSCLQKYFGGSSDRGTLLLLQGTTP